MDNKYKLFFHEDEIIANSVEGHTRWVAILSNGLRVYQDDFRQYDDFDDERRYSSWVRLRHYCLSENVSIVGMYIQFRTNRESMPENADGYYLSKSILGAFGMSENIHFFITGVVKDNQIFCKRWQIPELICTEEMIREVSSNDLCLILNKG